MILVLGLYPNLYNYPILNSIIHQPIKDEERSQLRRTNLRDWLPPEQHADKLKI